MSVDRKAGEMDARTFVLFLVMAMCLIPAILINSTPWLLASPALIVLLAFSARVRTVNRIEAQKRAELDGPSC